jgi:hypothetical protein
MSARMVPVIALLASGLIAPAIHAQQTRDTSARSGAGPLGLTGLWETETAVSVLAGDFFKPAAGTPAANAPAPAPGAAEAASVELAIFGHLKLLGKPPYNTEWEQKYQAALKRAATAAPPPPTSKFCEPFGFPAIMEAPFADGVFQLVVAAEETLILVPDGGVRQIYTDGRVHPTKEDLWPTSMGDSIGHWTGATLQVDTIARKAGPVTSFPMPGVADLSEQAHFSETLRLLDDNTLQDDMTIDDPLRFAKPWKLTIRYKRAAGLDRLIVTNCTENDRNPVVNGQLTIAPP